MANGKLTNRQIADKINTIANKHRGKLVNMDLSQHWIELDCPETNKLNCSIEIGRFLQIIQ